MTFLGLLFTPAPPANAGAVFPMDEQAFPVLITLLDANGVSVGTGSGFYLVESNKVYLVTARHVFFTPQPPFTLSQPFATAASFATGTNGSKFTYRFDLQLMLTNGLFKFGTNHDIAALMIGTQQVSPKDTNRMEIVLPHIMPGSIMASGGDLAALGGEMVAGYTEAIVGEDIYLFGYPVSVGMKNIPGGGAVQFDYDRPLLRKGIVSQKYDKAKTLIIDAAVAHGNSGGPVLVKEPNGLGQNYKVIGIVTETIPLIAAMKLDMQAHSLQPTDVSNSGYSVVEPMDTILELIRH